MKPIASVRQTRPARAAEVEKHSVLVNGHRVPFAVVGHGDPIVLIHGLCGSVRWWTPTLTLALNHRVYMVDLPGFGVLRHLGRQFSLATAADWIRAWMDAVGLERPSIIGHSMGAHIALRLAIEHPSRVARLAVIAPAGIIPVRSVFAHWRVFARAVSLTSWRFMVVLAKDVCRTLPSTLTSAAQALRTQDLRAELCLVSSPTLVICGEQDPLVPLETGRLLQQSIPSAELLVLERASHVPMFEDPTRVNLALTAFLAGAAEPLALSRAS